MKNRMAGCILLLLVLFPAKGWPGDKCDRIGEEMRSVMDQMQQVSLPYYDKKEGTAVVGSESEAEGIAAKLKALSEKANALRKEWANCVGMPMTEEAVRKNEADRNSEISRQKEIWEAQARKFDNPANAGNSGTAAQTPLMSPLQAPSEPPPPSSGGIPAHGSGRSPEQRAAALAAVNAELDRMPFLLPEKEDAPSKNDILEIAENRNASARKKFGPEDLSAYSAAVNWIPRFDGNASEREKAKKYSLIVSSATNYFNKPWFVIALASAVFSLDPESSANANNFASAIITAGERLNPGKPQAGELADFYEDAESCFRYAMAVSMKADAYTDESLTAIINLGHLYIDMGKPEEARSLFQIARKQSPFSWDAALGMAAYFHAVGQPDKALAVLEDDNLDKPVKYMVAKKSAKALEKNDEVPPESPNRVYEENIKAVNSEPMATAADFMAQIDQSARKKMRYFIENLPPKGSFTAPPINKLSQYASLQAISSPQGESALKDFMQTLQMYSISSYASMGNEQLKTLSRLGLDMDLGVDLNDVAKHPEKYADAKRKPKVKVDKSRLMANIGDWKKQAETARQDLATGKTGSILSLASDLDPVFTILQMDPETYADPMNIILQKHNFSVYSRKNSLYNGYLYSINKRIHRTFTEIAGQYLKKTEQAGKIQTKELAELEERRLAAGADITDTEWLIMAHNIHVAYFNQCNSAAEVAFGSATQLACTAYMKEIKPNAEAYYYDVIRHVALITDPDVRDQKEAELRKSIYGALTQALNAVAAAHGSFKHHDEWDCGCNLQSLLQQREEEQAARREEENARIRRNKNAKLRFESGEIPESTPLYKKLDAYGFDFDYFFFKGRMSCARTVVHFNLKLPVPGSPELFASQSISEFTGAATYGQGIKVSVGAGEGDVKAGAYLNLSSSVTTDGQGVVKDYSVTAGTGLSVSARGTSASIGGELTFGPNGVQDSDFSAGVTRDFGNEMGGSGSVSFEASTKRGCSFSGKVEQSLDSAKDFVDQSKTKAVGEDMAGVIPTDDFLQKELWSGKFSL